MGTGLGGESYAIIGQERIGQLLSSKPQDRRSIINSSFPDPPQRAGGASSSGP